MRVVGEAKHISETDEAYINNGEIEHVLAIDVDTEISRMARMIAVTRLNGVLKT